MRRDLSTLDRDIGQDWSRIIQEAFADGIDGIIMQGGRLVNRPAQGIRAVSTIQNYLLGSRLMTKDGRVFYYAKAGGACKVGYGCRYHGTIIWDGNTAKATAINDLTVMLKNDGIAITENELYGGYVLIHHATNMQCRRIIANNASPSATAGAIAAANKGAAGAGSFEITADVHATFLAGDKIVVYGSTLNDGIYTVSADSVYDTSTTILVDEAVVDDTVDGNITGVIVLTLEEPITGVFAIDSWTEVLSNMYADLRTDGGEKQSFAGVPGTYATNNEYFWVQTWGECWIVPGGAAGGVVGEDSFNRTLVFVGDGSVNNFKDVSNNIVGYQVAGFIIENNTSVTGPPLVMLQIRP